MATPSMEMKLSQQDRALLKKLTKSLDNLAISLGKNQRQAPKSPSRLSEPFEGTGGELVFTQVAGARAVEPQKCSATTGITCQEEGYPTCYC